MYERDSAVYPDALLRHGIVCKPLDQYVRSKCPKNKLLLREICLVLVPYSQNPNFVARTEPLSDIKRQFGLDQQEHSLKSRRRVSLYGLGGVG